MKHKVRCVICDREERVEIDEKTGEIKSEWAYFKRVNINACKTSKYFYRLTGDDTLDSKRISNPRYDPGVKPRYIELWECPECSKR